MTTQVGLDRDTLDMMLSPLDAFVAEALPDHRRLDLDHEDVCPKETIPAMCGEGLGVRLVFIPEEYGGLAGGAGTRYAAWCTAAPPGWPPRRAPAIVLRWVARPLPARATDARLNRPGAVAWHLQRTGPSAESTAATIVLDLLAIDRPGYLDAVRHLASARSPESLTNGSPPSDPSDFRPPERGLGGAKAG
jgi:hypothetical protein